MTIHDKPEKRPGTPVCRAPWCDKYARWPAKSGSEDNRRFCSQRCAADWAFEMVSGEYWSQGEQDWIDWGDPSAEEPNPPKYPAERRG